MSPVHSGRGHQENLRNLKHLVSISDRGREKSAFCKKMGRHLVGVKGVSRVR